MILFIIPAVVCFILTLFLAFVTYDACTTQTQPGAGLVYIILTLFMALAGAASIDAAYRRANPEPAPAPPVCTCVVAEPARLAEAESQ